MTLGSRIASAIAQLTLSNALVRLLSLVTMPVLTHLLAPNAYGIAAIVGTLISLVSVFALAGMDMSYVRSYHQEGLASGQAVEIYAWRYVLVGGVVAGVIVTLAWKFVISNLFVLPIYLAGFVGVGVLLAVSKELTTIRARLNNRYGAMSLSIILAGIGTATISIGLAYWWIQNELPLVLSMLAAYLIPILVLGIPPLNKLRNPSGLNMAQRIDILKIGLAGIFTAPMFWIVSSSDRWFLVYFEDAASVGIYSIGYSVAIMGMMFNRAVTSVWLPEAVKEFEEKPDHSRETLGKACERVVIFYAIIWLAITAAGGDVVRLLAASAFHGAASIVPLIAGAVFFNGVSSLMRTNLLLAKKLNYSIMIWIAGGLLCVLLNLFLIPLAGRFGAALTQVTTFAAIAGGMLYFAQKVFPVNFRSLRLIFLICGMIALGLYMFPAWTNSPATSLLIKFPIGFMASIIILRLFEPEGLNWITLRFALAIKRGS